MGFTKVEEANQESMESIFSRIHNSNFWGGRESLSGPGSDLIETAAIREQLPPVFNELGVQSLLDAPCGDFNWMKETAVALRTYIGVDIVPGVIAQNTAKYGGPGRQFYMLDITVDRLPHADLVLCRDCLVHLSFADLICALRNFKESDSKYIATTTYPGILKNDEIITGDWRPLNFQVSPFDWGPPLRLIKERVDLSQYGIQGDKCLGFWRIADINLVHLQQALAKMAIRYYQSPSERKFHQTIKDIGVVISEDQKYILVDEKYISASSSGLGCYIPFLEKDGEHWGNPVDDATAIRELERLRRSKANFIVFAWPSFWWLDYYSGFYRYLRTNFKCLLENDRLVVFDLRSGNSASHD